MRGGRADEKEYYERKMGRRKGKVGREREKEE